MAQMALRQNPSARNIIHCRTAKPRISFEFDDCYDDAYLTAKPILDGYGFKGVANVITDDIGTPTHLNVFQLQKLYFSGWEIGSHSKTHPNSMTGLDTLSATQELQVSKQVLETLGFDVYSFAVPNSTWSGTLANLAQQVGYESVRYANTTPPYIVYPILNRYYYLRRSNSISSLNYVFADVKGWIDSTVGANGWLILVFHHIGDLPADAYHTSITMFQQIVDYVASLDVDVVTQHEGLYGLLLPESRQLVSGR